MELTYDKMKEDYGSIKYNNEEYIIVDEVPYYDYQYKGHNQQEFYKGIAVKLGDEIDEDGFVPAYEMKWDIKNKDEIPPCDWNSPKEITENGYYQIEEI